MKMDPIKRDMTKYCEFHRDHGHRTDDCIQLKKKNQIPNSWTSPPLRGFRISEPSTSSPPRQPTLAQHQQPLGEINVISGGFSGGGEFSSARKAHLRNIISEETLEV